MGPVRFTQLLRFRVFLEVIVAIGQAEAALVEDPDVSRRVSRVLSHAEGEARVHAREMQLGKDGRKVVGRLQLRDRRENRGERRRAGLLAGRCVHAGRVEVRDLLLGRTLRPVRFLGGLLENLLHDVAVAVGELFEAAVARAVGGNRVRFQPRAVRVEVEVFARLHGEVHVRRVDAFRRGLRRYCRLGDRGGDAEGEAGENEQAQRLHGVLLEDRAV